VLGEDPEQGRLHLRVGEPVLPPYDHRRRADEAVGHPASFVLEVPRREAFRGAEQAVGGSHPFSIADVGGHTPFSSRPSTPATSTRIGSRFLNRQTNSRLAARIAPVGRSTTACRVSTIVAPAIAPAAAAVAPFTKARICGFSRWRMNHRPGTTTPR